MPRRAFQRTREHPLEFPDSTVRRQIHRVLQRWYSRHGRSLPWRSSADPYRIWISEIMLQQTTVAAVLPYFDRFLQQFPTVSALAAACEEDVLRLWEGLGYYSRARNLHKAARLIVEQHQSVFPQDLAALQALPGIGRYTAGAIYSFAFGRPAPVLEANTRRLYARLMALPLQVQSAAGQKQLWAFAEWLAAPDAPAGMFSPGDLNQALMDVGALICRPVDPGCSECPLAPYCRARAEGLQHQIPHTSPRAEITRTTELSVAIQRGEQFLLRQRGDGERWSGLWDFPRFPVSPADVDMFLRSAGADPDPSSHDRTRTLSRHTVSARKAETPDPPLLAPMPDAWIRQLADETGLQLSHAELATEIHHTVTRFRIRLICVRIELQTRKIRWPNHWQLFTADAVSQLPLSRTGRQFFRFLTERPSHSPNRRTSRSVRHDPE